MTDKRVEEIAEVIYNTWSDQPDFVKWVKFGNSLKQSEARSHAMRVIGIAGIDKSPKEFPCPHHFHRLVTHCEWQDEQIARLNRELHMFRYYGNNEYWGWQSDGENFLASLTCPILISANDMRDIVNNVNLTSLKDS